MTYVGGGVENYEFTVGLVALCTVCAVDDESGSLNAVHENLDDIEYTQSTLLSHQLLSQD